MRWFVLLLTIPVHGATMYVSGRTFSGGAVSGTCPLAATCSIWDGVSSLNSIGAASDDGLTLHAMASLGTNSGFSLDAVGIGTTTLLFTDGVGQGIATFALNRYTAGSQGFTYDYWISSGANRLLAGSGPFYAGVPRIDTVVVPFVYGTPVPLSVSFVAHLAATDYPWSCCGSGIYVASAELSWTVTHAQVFKTGLSDVPIVASPEPSNWVLISAGVLLCLASRLRKAG